MTLQQIVYRIRNHVSGGQSTNNSDVSPKQIEYDVNQLRSTMVRREWRNLNPQDFYQSIDLNFSEVNDTIDALEINFMSITSEANVEIYKSSTAIPQLCSVADEIPARLTTNKFGSIKFVESNRFSLHGFNKYSSKNLVATIYKGDIYIAYVDTLMEHNEFQIDNNNFDNIIESEDIPVSATFYGIFEDPSEIDSFDSQSRYPTPSQMQMRIIESLLKRYYNQTRIPEDKTLDLEDDGMVS